MPLSELWDHVKGRHGVKDPNRFIAECGISKSSLDDGVRLDLGQSGSAADAKPALKHLKIKLPEITFGTAPLTPPFGEWAGIAQDILDSIKAEMQEGCKPSRFRVVSVRQEGIGVRVRVCVGDDDVLDESLEGAAAWWKGNPNGRADVLSVIPETDEINLRYVVGPLPKNGNDLKIYPPLYLDALREIWESPWSMNCLRWLEQARGASPRTLPFVRPIPDFPHLRDAQRQAFGLMNYSASFLWGPPGTGKTYTLGAMLAYYLLVTPKPKALLLSTTNSAVDEALISVDKALEGLAATNGKARVLRERCKRIGSHFVASKYEAEGRRHLLPTLDPGLVTRLAELETQRPEPSDLNSYHDWKNKVDELRRLIPKPLHDSALAAMTTTGAAFFFDSLKTEAPYDVIVFDEASQVNMAYALALAPLGRSTVFAGDPQQLPPIAKSKRPYLMQSVFDAITNRTECLLNEQGRMAEPICEVVSKLFYKGKLIVAKDCENNRDWLRQRCLHPVPPMGQRHVYVHECDGTHDPTYGGAQLRKTSAEFIVDAVAKLQAVESKDILVLTPYRKQRVYIRNLLRREGIKGVQVSTVHKAQGVQCHTVIFDPVVGNEKFLTSEETGKKLINVAFSRAMARLIVVVSPRDLRNKWLSQLRDIAWNGASAPANATPVQQVAFRSGFPSDWIGKKINCHGVVGTVTGVHSGGFSLADIVTGEERRFNLKVVLDRCHQTRN